MDPLLPPRPPRTLRAARVIREDVAELRANWYWFALFGAGLIGLGLFALAYSLVATIATVAVFGYFLLVAGGFYLVGAFFSRGWGGFFLTLLAGVLYLVGGAVVVRHPVQLAELYTLFLAALFFVEGLFRLIAAVGGRFRNWGWEALSGLVGVALGAMIWQQWPVSGLWVIGTFVGVNLIVSGWASLLLGLVVRRLPADGIIPSAGDPPPTSPGPI